MPRKKKPDTKVEPEVRARPRRVLHDYNRFVQASTRYRRCRRLPCATASA